MLLVVDTGVLVSTVDSSEPRHEVSPNLLRDHAGGLAVPGPAAESQFLKLITRRELDIIDLTIADYQRCITLIDTYADMGLGLVDASVIAVAENLGVTPIATHSQRDFRVVKPIHVDASTLLP